MSEKYRRNRGATLLATQYLQAAQQNALTRRGAGRGSRVRCRVGPIPPKPVKSRRWPFLAVYACVVGFAILATGLAFYPNPAHSCYYVPEWLEFIP